MNNVLTLQKYILSRLLISTIMVLLLLPQIGSSQCGEDFQDADNDGICDPLDQCPNFDDDIDIDNDGIPYCQDNCIDVNENGICDEVDIEPINKKLKIHFSLKRGFFDNAIEVILIPNHPNTSIRYTVGANPYCPSVDAGTLYSNPIQISNQEDLQTLKVIGFNEEQTTKVYTHTYIFNGFNLPTVVFSCSPYPAAPEKRETPISFEFIVPNSSPLKSVQEYAGTKTSSGGLHSGRSDKVYFRSAYGEGTLKEDLFSDFYYGRQKPVKKIDQLFLRSNHADESLMKQLIAHDALRSTGVFAPAGRFVYLYKKGKIAEVRHLQERPEGGFMEAQTGQDKSNFEAYPGNIHAGLYAKISSSWEETRTAINIESFCNFLLNQWIANVADFNHYKNYRTAGPTDLDKADGGDLAWHFFNWDMDLGYRDNTSSNSYASPRLILRNLREHTAFQLRFADIINCTMQNEGVFTESSYLNRIFERSNELELFLANHNELNINTNRFLTQVSDFIPARLQWLRSDFEEKNYSSNLKELTYSLEEGIIVSGQQLTLSNPNESGNIYYTLDGSDVRTEAGVLKAEAILYQGPIQLTTGVYDVFARVYEPSAEKIIDRWSATCGAKTFYAEQAYNNIIINEIHYNPKATITEQDTLAGKNYEFLELKNIGTTPVDLNGSRFSKGIELTIETSLIIPPNGFAVFAEDAAAFQVTYGFAPDGEYSGKLNNDGEKINLKDPFGNFIDSLRYDNKDLWDEGADSTSFSLELLHPTLNNNTPLNWFRSDKEGGTPRAENSRTCLESGGKIIINEINYNSNKDQRSAGDWVELHNPTTESIDLSGWTLYDSKAAFVLPQGSYLAADGYVVLVANEDDFTTAFPTVSSDKIFGELPFKLSNKGERISLFDANKCMVDYVIYDDKLPWPEAADGYGPSLSLLDPALDNSLPESWTSSTAMNIAYTNGSPGASNGCVLGNPCNDGDPCTTGELYDENCNCKDGIISDVDLDGICDAEDVCNDLNDNLLGQVCDDGNPLTANDIYDANTCSCSGVIMDSENILIDSCEVSYRDQDEDGICDYIDNCPNIANSPQEDTDGNGIGDACEQQGVFYEDCGYRFIHEGLIISTYGIQDAYILITELLTNRLILHCDSWAGKNCADSLKIELEPNKKYEVRILNLISRCESIDTLITRSAFIESFIGNARRVSKNLQSEKSLAKVQASKDQKKQENRSINSFFSIEPTIEHKVRVYPNPVQQVLNIEVVAYGNKVEKIRLVNSMGQEVISPVTVATKSPDQIYTIDVSHLNSALYFLQILGDGEVIEAQKIIIK